MSVCLSVCLFVCLYPINFKTAEPISPKFFVGHLGTPGKVYESSKFQIFVSIKIRSSLNFLKFCKSAKFFCENPRIIFILFYDVHKENMFRTNLEDGREALSKACILIFWNNIERSHWTNQSEQHSVSYIWNQTCFVL